MKKILNIYHKDCLDGATSAVAVLKYCNINKYEYTGLPMSYDYKLANINYKDYDEIYVTDFSLRKEDFETILNDFEENITCIDHHIGVEDSLKEIYDNYINFNYVFNNEKSGAVLTWEFLHDKDDIPETVYNVQDRDLWKFEYENTKATCSFLHLFIDDLEKLQNEMKNEVSAYKQGSILLLEKEKNIKRIFCMCKDQYVDLMVNYKFVKCFNSTMYQSELGNLLSEYHNEVVGIYTIVGLDAHMSFRSIEGQELTALEVAKKLGGGGHKHAAGASIERIDLFN